MKIRKLIRITMTRALKKIAFDHIGIVVNLNLDSASIFG